MSRDPATAVQPGRGERNFVGVGGRNAMFGSADLTPGWEGGREGACCRLSSSPCEIHAGCLRECGFHGPSLPCNGYCHSEVVGLESTRKRYGLDFRLR